MAEFSMDTSDLEKLQKDLDEPINEGEIDNNEVDPIIKEKARGNVALIFEGNLDSPTSRENILKPINDFGKAPLQRSAQRNQLVSTRLVDLNISGEDAGDVGTNLSQLNMQIKDLDPSMLDFAKKGVLGKLFNPIRRYFNKYQKADNAIADIVKSLDKGSKILKNDNTTLLAEEKTLNEITNKLKIDVEMGRALDDAIEERLLEAEAEGYDGKKIDFIREEIHFPLRRRIQDMQQMIVVNQNGMIAMNVIRKNNKELIRGVERAKNVTLTALRTGVMVASALYNQKVLIQKIQTLNETTENIIESTSRMLKEQGAEIQRQSMEATVSPDVLKRAFADALTAIEDVSTFRTNALPDMQKTIDEFREMADEGQVVIDRIEKEQE